MKPLPQSFYARPTLKVANDLLGKHLVHVFNGRKIIGQISEVEAYVGPRDKASHASKGLTPRTQVMFGPPGFWYVYLVYGMYHCLNVVTEKAGLPAAVLIRSVQSESLKEKTDGPGKLCRAFKVTRELNDTAAFKAPLFIAQGVRINPSRVGAGKRIGVDYAGEYKDKLWRFFIKP